MSYTVKSAKACKANPQRCWMNIGVEKLQAAAASHQPYRFIFTIGGKRYEYSCAADDLLHTFQDQGVSIIPTNIPRYSFYADYANGALFHTPSPRVHEPLISLKLEGEYPAEGGAAGACPSGSGAPGRIDCASGMNSPGEESGEAVEESSEPERPICKTLRDLDLARLSPGRMGTKALEIYNFQKLAALLADYGLESMRLVNDWKGADFIAYNANTNTTLSIQLKSTGISVCKKYENKDLYIAFTGNEGEWYLIDYDELETLVPRSWFESETWQSKGSYYSRTISRKMQEKLRPYRLN